MSLWSVLDSHKHGGKTTGYLSALCGCDPASGLFLDELLYWHRPDAKGKDKRIAIKNHKTWVAHTVRFWETVVGISPNTYRRVVARLEENGILETTVGRFSGQASVYYRLDLNRMEEAMLRFDATGKPIPQKCGNDRITPVESTEGTLLKAQKSTCGNHTSHIRALEGSSDRALYTGTVVPSERVDQQQEQGRASEKDGKSKSSSVTYAFMEKRATMVRVNDVLKKNTDGTHSPITKGVEDAVACHWKREVVGAHDVGFLKDLTKPQKAMLRRVVKALDGHPHDGFAVMAEAIRNWRRFTEQVQDDKGIKSVPALPNVEFFAKHYDVSAQSIARRDERDARNAKIAKALEGGQSKTPQVPLTKQPAEKLLTEEDLLDWENKSTP